MSDLAALPAGARLFESGGRFIVYAPDPSATLLLPILIAEPDWTRVKGLMRDKPPAPPTSPIALGMVLAELPTDTLKAMRAAVQAAQEKARAIEVGS